MNAQAPDTETQGIDFPRLAQRFAKRYAQLVIDALGGEVPPEVGRVLYRVGYELGHDACKTLADEIRTRIAEARRSVTPVEEVTVSITRDQLEGWAGRPLTAAEVSEIDGCIPLSSIPEALGEIAAQIEFDDVRGDDR